LKSDPNGNDRLVFRKGKNTIFFETPVLVNNGSHEDLLIPQPLTCKVGYFDFPGAQRTSDGRQ